MEIIQSIADMRARALQFRNEGKSIALVPTRGSLHEGQLSLIKLARERADACVLSIYLNPVQIAPYEKAALEGYNRDHDLELCRNAEVDVAFLPAHDEFQPPDFSSYLVEEDLSAGLCGVSRPQLFRGVTTCAAKLFNIVGPDFAVFGQKGAQEAAVVRKIVRDLAFPVQILVGPTIRESDGLAMSAHNKLLSTHQRAEAAAIGESLNIAADMVASGVRNVDRVMAEITHHLAKFRRLRVIYVAVVHCDSIKPLREIVPGQTLITTAVWCDETRMIDNVLV